MASKPKVLILIDTQILGGPGKGLLQLIKNVDRDRWEYILGSFKYKRPRSTEFIDRAAEAGLNLKLFSQRFRFDPSPVLAVTRLARREHYNIIQSHGYKAHTIAFLASRIARVHWVAMTHGWTDEDWKVRMYNALERRLLKLADVALVVSRTLFDEVSELRGKTKPTRLVMNAVDSSELKSHNGGLAIRQRLGIGKEQILLGTFGRLSPEKGQDIAVQALSKVVKSGLDASLMIVGDGQERVRLEGLASSLGVCDRLHFIGYQSTMRDYFEAIDLYVLPSRSEGLPNVVLEAMSLGKPVVAADVGSVSDVICDGSTGWIVPPNDPMALAAKIDEAARDRTNLATVARRAQESLYPRFCPRERAAKFLHVYEALQKGTDS